MPILLALGLRFSLISLINAFDNYIFTELIDFDCLNYNFSADFYSLFIDRITIVFELFGSGCICTTSDSLYS